MEVNSKEYWDKRFSSGNWNRNGRKQTTEYAKANIRHVDIPSEFHGSILDFGCALGDAIPVYKEYYPKATVYGYDISDAAIKKCVKRFGDIAGFLTGNYRDLPQYDIIIASHVMEHLNGDEAIVSELLEKCNDLFVFVPYKESPLYFEHVNYYEEDYYKNITPTEIEVFDVEYHALSTLVAFIKGLLKFRLSFFTRFSRKIIMYHWSRK